MRKRRQGKMKIKIKEIIKKSQKNKKKMGKKE